MSWGPAPDPRDVSVSGNSTLITKDFTKKIKREGLEKRKPVFPEAASQHYFSRTRCQIQEGFQMAFTDGETEAQGVEKKKTLPSDHMASQWLSNCWLLILKPLILWA